MLIFLLQQLISEQAKNSPESEVLIHKSSRHLQTSLANRNELRVYYINRQTEGKIQVRT